MNDIDFDELDRAVSSLIGKPANAHSNPGPSPSNQGSAVPANAPTPAPPSPQPTPATSVAPRQRPSISPLPASPTGATAHTAPAARRAGRFMDVVHPSARKPSTPPSSAPAQPERPVKPAAVPQPTRISYTGKKLEPVADAPKPHLDLSSLHPESEADDEPLLVAKTSSHPEVKPEQKVEENKPDLSPPLFLSGTKVEKRPLGQFSAAKEIPEENKPGATGEEPKKTSVDDIPLKGSTGLPPELNNKVVAVEAGDVEPAEEEDRPDTPPAFPPESKFPKEAPKTASSAHKVQSIPTQYKAKHAETDMTPRPIFDTKDYHQPLAHPTKKSGRKPWVWALLALSLLAVGAALGVGAYFLLG